MMTIAEILQFLNDRGIQFEYKGDLGASVDGFSSLRNYKEGTLTWAKNKQAYQYEFDDKVLVVAQKGLAIDARNVIESEESKLAFFSLVEYMAEKNGQKNAEDGNSIGAGSVIGEKVRIGRNVMIGCNCALLGDIAIGDNTRIWNNVTILNRVAIGKHCEIQSGCVIGHDGFAWNEDGEHKKHMIRHYGGVDIGDHVYMGPNCIVDRGEIDETKIGTGAKIDAGCFVAHNAIVGKNAIMIAGSKLYGSAEIGENSYIASATVRNQCKIGNNAFVGIGSVVTKNLPPNTVSFGVPAVVRSEKKDVL